MNCTLLVRPMFAALALMCCSGVVSAQLSTSRDPNAVGVDGTVRYFAERHGRIYLSGGVQAVGMHTAPFVELDLANASRLASLPVPNGEVHAMVSDGAGGWFLGGDFTAVGSVPRNYLAHLLADGTVDPEWNPEPSLTVFGSPDRVVIGRQSVATQSADSPSDATCKRSTQRFPMSRLP